MGIGFPWRIAMSIALLLSLLHCAKEGTGEVRTVRSGRISPLDALPKRNPFAIRLSLRRLRGTALAEMVPSLVRETTLGDRYGEWVRACKGAPIDAFHEIVIGLGDHERLIAAELVIPPDVALGCVRAAFGATDVMFQERPALRIKADPPLFVLTVGDLLFAGDEVSLSEALDASGRSGPLASCLDLGQDAFIAACGSPPKVALVATELRGTARSTASELSVEAALTFADASGVSALAERIAAAKKNAGDQEKFVRDALDTVRVEPSKRPGADGDTVATVKFGTSGDGMAQSTYLVALATAVRQSYWREEAKALTEEARTNVATIAEKLRQSAEGEVQRRTSIREKSRPRGPVFPLAPPPVPAEVPRATVYEPREADFEHPTWAALGITLKPPIRFRYEIIVTADRRRAAVRARGDLDGDGELSLFEIVLEARNGAIVVSPMKVRDELE